MLLVWVLAACSVAVETPEFPAATPEPGATTPALPASSPSPTLTLTPEGPGFLTVCLGQEPASLFLYADSTPAARSVYQAIYDGPFDWLDYSAEPVILERLPSLGNGGVRFEAVEASQGDLIVNNDGDWATLEAGVAYRPSGCQSPECALTYSGSETVSLDRMVIAFTLKAGLKWSNGAALTADDSVYSYEVARSLYPAYRPDLINLTHSYQALDSLTVEWRGAPGYQGGQPEAVFFTPLPRHAWGALDPEQLYTDESSSRSPLGWGPYTIDSWVAGDHITLIKNPNYYRASDGLPAFDHLVFRFVSNAQEAVDALLAGECQLIDQTVDLSSAESDLVALQDQGRLQLISLPYTGWEALTFGVTPADPARVNPLSLKEVRQAAAYCIDRESLAASLGETPLLSFLPANHPLSQASDIPAYAYDPGQGAGLLEDAGWIDEDSDPATPRVYRGAANIPAGTALTVEYYVPDDGERRSAAEMVAAGLEGCGFEVKTSVMSWGEVMAPGPEGPVFGRAFDLAQFGWAAASFPPCSLYLSGEIPGPYPDHPKGWGGANASGFSSAEYDAACRSVLYSLPESESFAQAAADSQALFLEDLPALPLYQHSAQVAASTDICGLETDRVSDSILWNLEELSECGE